MGGMLSVQSEPGQGSTVTVTLPRQPRGVEEWKDARMEIHRQAA
jgi:signal transduction histidine kinase